MNAGIISGACLSFIRLLEFSKYLFCWVFIEMEFQISKTTEIIQNILVFFGLVIK